MNDAFTFTAEMACRIAESEEVKIGIIPILRRLKKLVETGAKSIEVSRLSPSQVNYLLSRGFKLQKTGQLIDKSYVYKIEW